MKRLKAKDGSRVAKGGKSILKERETDILRLILDYLKVRGIFHWRMPGQGTAYTKNGEMQFRRSSIAGFPDIAGIYKSTFFALEVKTSKGKVSKLQEEYILKINLNGGYAVVVRSLEDAQRVVDTIDKHVY